MDDSVLLPARGCSGVEVTEAAEDSSLLVLNDADSPPLRCDIRRRYSDSDTCSTKIHW